jgi:shikimate dehydrogenase
MTDRFVLIGHPVGHSISPAIHGAAYEALRLDCSYEAVDCPDADSVREQVERIRSREVIGANVTVPHKRLALALADRLDDSAKVPQAANVLLRAPDGAVEAHNTDTVALADELAAARGAEVAIIIGSGGASLAAIVACRALGVEEVFVVARKFVAGEPVESWPFAADFSASGARLLAWPTTAESREIFDAVTSRARLFIQATSAGMKGADPGHAVAELVPWTRVSRNAFAYDVVYNPAITPFMLAARAQGIAASNGLGMLVGQAARAFTLWLGIPAPLAAMQKAAERALYGAVR